MATHQLAQGLASLGRHGDSMLMHVSPSEVAGLSALGKMTGHKLHTNPHTGMPEAFDFGSFLTSLLPTAAGFLVGGPAGAGLGLKAGSTAATLAPIAAGVATGAAVAGAKGDDVLMGGLMGGLGGYGGGNMGNAFRAATNPGITNTISGNIGDSLASQADDLASNTALNSVKGGTTGIDFSQVAQNAGAPGVTLSPSDLAKGALSETRGTLPSFTPQAAGGTSSMMDTAGRFVENLGGVGPASLSLGAPTLMAGYEAGMFTPKIDTSLEEKRKAEENKYRDKITGGLNLLQASPDLRLAASGGLMSAYATGGTVNTNSSTISSGGIQDLYGTNDQTTGTQNLSKEGYGIGRLNSLAAEGSRAKAADTFYAMGGPIAFAQGGHQGYLDGDGDGMSDSIPATIEGKQEARLADGEFVIPADVVSHIGNGSSKAGSKQLYAMLDRIRKARTGHTKQGKEIKPHKYMPA
jgi:hypothetical protein